MDKHQLPRPSLTSSTRILVTLAVLVALYASYSPGPSRQPHGIDIQEARAKCHMIRLKPGPPDDFSAREVSDRFVEGTPPVFIHNATLWTGDGVVHQGGLLLHNGIIKEVGPVNIEGYANLSIIDAAGAWVTPGIIDLHSHLGVDSVPFLQGAADTNSHKGLAQPWLRSLDGLNTHDEAFTLSIAGGVTTANVLPGSAGAIGGQAFTIKLRSTREKTPGSMLLEPPLNIGPRINTNQTIVPWRQMKHACGENPSRVYSGTRMDTIWAFRDAYNQARKLRDSQDAFCAKVESDRWDLLSPGETFPEDLQWEALVDVLRGRVKVHTHCYEAVDLDDLVRLTNEFKFPIAAFHHAHEAYLIPDTLKAAYGHTPVVAMFAGHSQYKREAYRGSEFAPRILAEAGIPVVMKSDHPVTDSRHLLFQAQLAFYFGLPLDTALASVTSAPAKAMGMSHRIGYLRRGYDADVVIWDLHPISVSAIPQQVFIDGIPQLPQAFISRKPPIGQTAPKLPNFDIEAQQAVEYSGLPPLAPTQVTETVVVFDNVSHFWVVDGGSVVDLLGHMPKGFKTGKVFVKDGEVNCVGSCDQVVPANAVVVDLEGGAICPGLIAIGSSLGLGHITGEPSTMDGLVPDNLSNNVPAILGGSSGVLLQAVDGLQFSTRNALLAYRSGATYGVTAPMSKGLINGISVAFSTGVEHKLSPGAIIVNKVALHVTVGHGPVSISGQIATLRSLLTDEAGNSTLAAEFAAVAKGARPLLINVESADIMASLIQLKQEVESLRQSSMRVTFVGASEAHLLAKEIGEAGIGVIPLTLTHQPFPSTWESRRILPGHPLSENNVVNYLRSHNITVGLGLPLPTDSRFTSLHSGWTGLDNKFTKEQSLELATVHLEKLLGLDQLEPKWRDLVAVKHGSFLFFEGQPVAVISPRRKAVDLLSSRLP